MAKFGTKFSIDFGTKFCVPDTPILGGTLQTGRPRKRRRIAMDSALRAYGDRMMKSTRGPLSREGMGVRQRRLRQESETWVRKISCREISLRSGALVLNMHSLRGCTRSVLVTTFRQHTVLAVHGQTAALSSPSNRALATRSAHT